jgi:hypothetical protein
MEPKDIQDSVIKLNLSKFETVDLCKLLEVLNQLFSDEIDYWYNYTADGEKKEARAHYLCALLVCNALEEIHKILLSRAV